MERESVSFRHRERWPMIERCEGVRGVVGWPVVQGRTGPRPDATAAEGQERPRPAAAMAFRPFDRRAEFLAQLIAMRDGLPQARERRRAAPEEAIRAYREAMALDDCLEAEFDEVV
jgi:hypothetical protein